MKIIIQTDCRDTDCGFNYKLTGVVIIGGSNMTDYCPYGRNLVEFYCLGGYLFCDARLCR